MRRILSALTIVAAGLAFGACEKPCPEGYGRSGLKCKPLPDAGSDSGPASNRDGGGQGLPDEAGTASDSGTVAGEICDGADNDDDGNKDEGFACVSGAADTTCTTSCGSTGIGTCTAQCQVPTAGACVAPMEQCDRIDQDCDGIADDGFSYSTLGYQVWTQTEFATDKPPTVGNVALLKRNAGGAWMAYRAFDADDVERDLRVGRLDANGLYLDSPTTPRKPGDAIAWDGTTRWTADSDGKWIALLVRHRAPGAPSPSTTKTMMLQIFSAEDFSFAAEIELASVVNDLDVTPQDVSVFEDAEGNLQTLAVYNLIQPAMATQTLYSVATRTPSGGFSQKTRTLLAQALHGGAVAVAKIPCHEEWLLGHALLINEGRYRDLRRVDTHAEFVGAAVDTLVDSTGLLGLAAGESECADGGPDPQMLAVYAISDFGTRSRVWSVDRATGAFSSVGSDFDLGLTNVAAIQSGGRWFVAGIAQAPNFNASASEVNPLAPASDRTKAVPLFQGTTGADPGYLGAGYGFGFTMPTRSAVIDAGRAVVFGFPSGFANTTASPNLDALRTTALPNSTAPATAVTYRVGCP